MTKITVLDLQGHDLEDKDAEYIAHKLIDNMVYLTISIFLLLFHLSQFHSGN